MTVLATIAIDTTDVELGEILSGYETCVELPQFVPIDSDLVPSFWADKHDLDTFEEDVRADDHVGELTYRDGAVDRRLSQTEWAEAIDSVLSALDDHDLLVEHATGTDDEWTFRLRAHDREPLAAFQAACTDHGITLRIQEVHHNPDDPDQPADGLTEKQQKALVLAHTNGYLEISHAWSVTDLDEGA